MQRVNEFVFYELAKKLDKLMGFNGVETVKYAEIWVPWSEAREAIEEIYRQRPLSVATPSAIKLVNAINAVVPIKFEDVIAKLRTEEKDSDIPPWTVASVSSAAIEFETVLRNECQVMDTYFVNKKGAYSTIDLIENAHRQIPEPIRGKLPDLTKSDFDQAGRCIAFDIPTAAAFHLLRGTEAVVRRYYELVVPGAKQAPKKMRNWGAYIRLLEAHGANEKVTSLLTHLKDLYRNPVLHPDENYTDDGVLVLMGVCISAVVLMQLEIDNLTAKGGTLQFPPHALTVAATE